MTLSRIFHKTYGKSNLLTIHVTSRYHSLISSHSAPESTVMLFVTQQNLQVVTFWLRGKPRNVENIVDSSGERLTLHNILSKNRAK
jgi:hypothetical protein